MSSDLTYLHERGKSSKQFQAISNAKRYLYANNYAMFERWVRRAAKFRPLSEHQWHNLKMKAGHERVEKLQEGLSL